MLSRNKAFLSYYLDAGCEFIGGVYVKAQESMALAHPC